MLHALHLARSGRAARRLAAAALIAGPAAPATAQDAGPEAELAAVAEAFRGENDRFGVLLARRDALGTRVWTAGDVRAGDRLRLASVSKVFVAYLFLRERADVDAPIAAYYAADRHPHAERVTPRMLLNHTSGVADEMGRRMRELGPGADPAEVLRAVQALVSAPAAPPDERIAALYSHDAGLDFEPGTAWCYSNTGYYMLGRMLERATGEPYERLLVRHFGAVAPSLRLDDGRTDGFPESYLRPWPIHWSQPWVAGALVATAADALAAFDHVAAQPEFARMQEWTTAPRCPADVVAGDDYGLGLQRYLLDGVGDAVGHDGHIIARTLVVRRDDASWLIHTTRAVTNPELRAIAARLIAAAR